MTQVSHLEDAPTGEGDGRERDRDDRPSTGTRVIRQLAQWILGVGVAFIAVALILILLGHNPFSVVASMIDGSLGTPFGRGQTVRVATPLILTGLAALVPFSARLWNVGGEGQMAVGGVTAALVALNFDGVHGVTLLILTVAAGTAAGCVWGVLPGLLKAKFGANEIIVCLMLNFIAVLLVQYVVSGKWKSYSAQTVAIPEQARIPAISSLPGANWGIAVALAAVAVVTILLRRATLGFKIRSVGLNQRASRLTGISIAAITIATFAIGGLLAGLAGAIEVTGNSYALVQGFTGTIGLLGIAIALVARLNPIAVVPTAAAFAIVSVGGNNLTATQGIDPSLSTVLIASFVIVLLAAQVIDLHNKT